MLTKPPRRLRDHELQPESFEPSHENATTKDTSMSCRSLVRRLRDGLQNAGDSCRLYSDAEGLGRANSGVRHPEGTEESGRAAQQRFGRGVRIDLSPIVKSFTIQRKT